MQEQENTKDLFCYYIVVGGWAYVFFFQRHKNDNSAAMAWAISKRLMSTNEVGVFLCADSCTYDLRSESGNTKTVF
jgi:hypothetical protein